MLETCASTRPLSPLLSHATAPTVNLGRGRVPRCRLPVLLRSRWIPFSPLARCLASAPRVPHCHLPDGLWLPLPQDLCASWWKIREGRQVSPTASLLRCSFAFLSHDQVEKLMGERRGEAEAEATAKIMELCAAVGDRSSAKVTPKRPSGILRSPRARPCSNGATGSWPLSWCWAWRRTRRRGALRCPAPRSRVRRTSVMNQYVQTQSSLQLP